jgi:hypothetical protein
MGSISLKGGVQYSMGIYPVQSKAANAGDGQDILASRPSDRT